MNLKQYFKQRLMEGLYSRNPRRGRQSFSGTGDQLAEPELAEPELAAPELNVAELGAAELEAPPDVARPELARPPTPARSRTFDRGKNTKWERQRRW